MENKKRIAGGSKQQTLTPDMLPPHDFGASRYGNIPLKTRYPVGCICWSQNEKLPDDVQDIGEWEPVGICYAFRRTK